MSNAVEYYNQGYYYYRGENGYEQNYQKAALYFEKANELGYSDAANYLGIMFRNGYGVKKDIMKSIHYFESVSIGVENPNWFAAYNLADIFYLGDGVPKDLTRAQKIYDAITHYICGAPQQGKTFKEAPFRVGMITMNSNPHKALTYFLEAGRLGVPEAWHNLGYMFQNGYLYTVGNAPDLKIKTKSELTAEDRYIMKKCNSKDSSAAPYYEKAAELGYVDSMVALANIYLLNGMSDKGEKWLLKASSLGSKEAKKALRILHPFSFFK